MSADFQNKIKKLFGNVQFRVWKRTDKCWKCYITGRPDLILHNHYVLSCHNLKDIAKINVFKCLFSQKSNVISDNITNISIDIVPYISRLEC